MPSGIPKNGVNKGWFKGEGRKEITCKFCNIVFFARPNRIYCSKKCLWGSRKNKPSWNKGKPAPWAKNSKTGFKKGQEPWNKGLKRPEMTGERHPLWKGGKDVWPKCSVCGTTKNKYRNATSFCIKCYKKQAKGSNSPNWRGGINSVIKRRSQIAGAIGSHTLEQWEKLKESVLYMCLCCKKHEPEIKLTEDHIVPLSKGGSNDILNIQPLCKSCNSRKHANTINFIESYDFTRN